MGLEHTPAQHIPCVSQCLEDSALLLVWLGLHTLSLSPRQGGLLCSAGNSSRREISEGTASKIPEDCTSQKTIKAHTTGLVFLESFCFLPSQGTIRSTYHPFLSSHISSPLHTKCTCLSKIATNRAALLGSSVPGACPLEMLSMPLFPASLDLPPFLFPINSSTHKHRAKKHLQWGAFLLFFFTFLFFSVFLPEDASQAQKILYIH